MLVFTTRAGSAFAVALLLMALSGCGDDTRLPEAASATPFETSTVAITQQGNANATIDTHSVSFKLDDTRSLVVHATLTSNATSMISVSVRASLYDPGHSLIGDAIGGQVKVQPGQQIMLSLNGPTPLGTIASALFEVSEQPTPT
jgi:predicted small lipoprotein YifL